MYGFGAPHSPKISFALPTPRLWGHSTGPRWAR